MPAGRKRLIRLLGGQRRGNLGLRVLPNLITLAAMICGFFALVRAAAGDLTTACLFVLIATVLDGLDGKIARMASSESEIGQQYDSLADMVSFGVAPAAIFYLWAAPHASALALICAGLYLSCVALRLARFNIGGQEQGGPFYRGLPSPAAACSLCGLIWLESLYRSGDGASWAALVGGYALAAGLAGLMISNVKYYKFQRIRSPSGQSENFLSLLMAVAVFGLLIFSPSVGTFGLSTGYTLSGLVRPLNSRIRRLSTPPAQSGDASQGARRRRN